MAFVSDDPTAKSTRFVCSDADERRRGIDAAVAAIQRGELVVLPTDTVYGVAADAFEPDAVRRLLDAKGRGRDMPPPVLVGAMTALSGVAMDVPEEARALVEAFWPGALTVICKEQPSLAWDLGENDGTVAVRMPDDEIALELLRRTGPLAVSSANKTGKPAATTAEEAIEQLGEDVAVYLDGGPTPGAEPSSIVDVTRAVPCLVRAGALPLERLREVVPDLVDAGELAEIEAELAAREAEREAAAREAAERSAGAGHEAAAGTGASGEAQTQPAADTEAADAAADEEAADAADSGDSNESTEASPNQPRDDDAR